MIDNPCDYFVKVTESFISEALGPQNTDNVEQDERLLLNKEQLNTLFVGATDNRFKGNVMDESTIFKLPFIYETEKDDLYHFDLEHEVVSHFCLSIEEVFENINKNHCLFIRNKQIYEIYGVDKTRRPSGWADVKDIKAEINSSITLIHFDKFEKIFNSHKTLKFVS